MNDSIAEQVLELALKRTDQAEVIFEQSRTRSVEFVSNLLKSVSTSAERGIGLRVIHGGRIGFSSTTDLDALEDLVGCALASAEFGQEAAFAFPGPADAPQVRVYDPAVESLDMDRAVAMGREVIDQMLSARPGLQCTMEVVCAKDARRTVNSSGLDVGLESSTFEGGVWALQVTDAGLLEVGEGLEWRRPCDSLRPYASRILEKLALADRVAENTSGQLPVIFTPKAVGSLLATLCLNTSGKLVQKGVSVLKDSLGEQVLDKRLSLWDDALVDYAPGSTPTDGEGLPCARLPLFEKGVLRTFVYDLQTAGKMGCRSTGSANRSYRSQPAPGYANIRLEPGETAWEEMVRDVGRGVIADQVLGAGQSNVLAGEFSVNLDLGYLIEGGEVVGRLKDTMVAGNVFEALKEVVAIGRETEWHGEYELPALCLGGLSVAGGGA